MARKTYQQKDTNQLILGLNRRIAFISRKTGESEDRIRDLLVQYGMAILSYGDTDTEYTSLLLMMFFLAGRYIDTIKKGEKEIHVGELLNKKAHRNSYKNEQ